MSNVKDILYCHVHDTINTQCCGSKKEKWGTWETPKEVIDDVQEGEVREA